MRIRLILWFSTFLDFCCCCYKITCHDRLPPSFFPDNPLRGRGNPISEKLPHLKKVDAQFYMELDRKPMLVIKTFIY